MTNRWKRALSGIVTLAMLLSCAAISVFAAADDLTASDFILSAEGSGSTVTVKLVGTKAVSGWAAGAGTLSVKNASGADAKQYFALNGITTHIGDANNSVSSWFWSATADDVTNGDSIAENTVWVEYTLTASDAIPAGSYTFSMSFTSDDNFDKDSTNYAVDGETIAAVPYTVAAPTGYTVQLTDGVDGTAEVNPDGTVTMNVVVSGKGFNGMQAEIGYDSALFTLSSVAGSISDYDSSAAGTVSMYLLSKNVVATGTTVATLTFTAKALSGSETEKTGSFTIAKGTADNMSGFAAHDAVPATLVGDAVKVAVVKSYTITIDPNIANGSVGTDKTTANAGDTVTLTVNPNGGYELDTLSVTDANDADVTLAADNSFTMPASNVTVTATFKAKTYAVALTGALTGAATATHGVSYTATVTDYDTTKNDYTLTVTIGGTAYTSAAIASDGKITIPGSAITGDIAITLTTTTKPFNFGTVDDYVTGVTLVLVTGTNPSGYTYADNPMFYAAQYSAYAYLVDGAANSSNVAVAASGATCTTISAGYDVNGTGKVDFNDAGAAFGCYNKNYTVADNIALYLRADVDGNKKVDTADVSKIMENYTPDNTAGE